MILYRPTDGDVYEMPINWRPRTCFLMTQLSKPQPPIINSIRTDLVRILTEKGMNLIDADSKTTGKDFLLKICLLAISVPIGIAIIHEGISHKTISNIFYELGWMQAYGKEILLIKAGDGPIPSDFIRTEYVEYDSEFERRFRAFLDSLEERSEYYSYMAELVERNPLLAIDYLRRAYLLTGDKKLRKIAKDIFNDAGLDDRAKNSVEMLMVKF